jgi:hypothetical protein
MSKKHQTSQEKKIEPQTESDITSLAARVAQLEVDNAQLEAKLKTIPSKSKSHFSWRKVGVGSLLLIGALGLGAANLSAWADRTLINNDVYVKTVTPVASDPAIQTAIQAYAFKELNANVNYEQLVREVLPAQADILVVPLAGQLRNYSNQLIGTIVRSDQFSNVWVTVNSKVHQQLIKTVTDYKGNGTIDVSQLYSYISQRLENTPLKILANQKLPENIGQIKLLDVRGLKVAHDALVTLHWIRVWSWIITFFAFFGAVLLSRRRMHTIMAVGISIIIISVITVITFRVARTYALDQISDPVYRNAALSMWTILLNGLFEQTGGLIALGFVLAIGSWLAAGQGSIANLRLSAKKQSTKLSHNIWSSPETSGLVRWVTRFRRPLEWAVIVLGILVLMLFSPLSLTLVIGTAAGVLVMIMAIEFISTANMGRVI